jgi:hypothetical protein
VLDRINSTRTIAVGETDVFKHAIVDVPSVAAESQTVHPKMKREFSAKEANSIEWNIHDSLPTLDNPASLFAIAD